jgi:hypothetical protein
VSDQAPEGSPIAAPKPEADEPEVAPEAQHAPTASSRGLKAAVAVLAALTLGLAIVAASLSASNRNTKNRTEAVRSAAGAMGSALLTYDYQHLARTKSLVLRMSTGTFRKQYSQAFSGGLDTVLTNTKAVSHVRDIQVFVSDVSSNDASAIVVVDTVVSGTSGENRALTSYIQLDLVHSGRGWLVDGVTNLNLSLPATGGTSSTSTTSPSAPSTTR